MVHIQQKNKTLMRLASIASIVTAVSLIAVKGVTYLLTGSMAILSSLLDSIQDMMTSIVNFFAVRHATEPADDQHRFGHGKAQALGSLLQSIIIGLAGIYLIWESTNRFFDPTPIKSLGLGIVITIIAIVVTAALLTFQTYVINRTKSLSIRTDRAHYTGDIMMNVGVIISMVLAYYLKWDFVDSLFGICVGIYLLTVVFGLSKESCAMLMDTEIAKDLRIEIKQIIRNCPEVIDFTKLKTRYSGEHMFIQFIIYLDDETSLKSAHATTDKIEAAIHQKFPESDTLIHVEPASHKGKS